MMEKKEEQQALLSNDPDPDGNDQPDGGIETRRRSSDSSVLSVPFATDDLLENASARAPSLIARRYVVPSLLLVVGGLLMIVTSIWKFGPPLVSTLYDASSNEEPPSLAEQIPPPPPPPTSVPYTTLLDFPSPDLEPCDRILIFPMKTNNGFGSLWNYYIRAAAAAERLGFTFLEDDTEWQYGSITNYFQPRKLYCNPPRDWRDSAYMVSFGAKGWARARRVVFGRGARNALDIWEYETYLKDKDSQLRALRQENQEFAINGSRRILAASDGLPQVFEEVFKVYAATAQRLWKPSTQIEQEIMRVKEMVSMSKERPTIGFFIRTGDKKGEWSFGARVIGLKNKFGNLTMYYSAAQEALGRMTDGTSTPLSTNTRTFAPEIRPQVIVMTAEDDILPKLERHPLASGYDLVRTPRPNNVTSGHVASKFSAMPLQQRIAEGRSIVRDLTLLTRESDAFVVSAMSNLGRIAMLLGGYDALVGPFDPEQNRHLGGRIRSIDMFWYPMTRINLVTATGRE